MAKAKLEIDINAKNNAGPAIKEVASGLDKMVGRVDEALQAFTGLSLGQLTFAGALTKVTDTVVGAVQDYSAYVEQVDKMSMSTGMASEETSRLIQLADDFRVETAALENAMKLALQNGFNPTVENLAKLSDEYLKIQDPTERAAKMQEIFGRQWVDLVPLLQRGGDAIRDASDEIADSLVVTEEAIAANREYVAAMDELNDAWTGTKNELAQSLIPALTDLLEINNRMEENVDNSGAAWMRYIPVLGNVYNIIEGVRSASQQGADAQQALADSTEQVTAATEASVQQTEELVSTIEAQQKALDGLVSKQASWEAGVGKQVANLLEKSGVNGLQYDRALLTIDRTMGTNLDTQRRMDESMQSLVDRYAAGELSQREFETGLTQLRDAFDPTKNQIDEATKKLQALEAQLYKMNNIQMTISVKVDDLGGSGGSGGKGGGGGSNSPIKQRYATGGWLEPHQAVQWNEQGREMLLTDGGGFILNAAETKNLIDALRRITEGGMNSGLPPVYNLTVQTSQSPNLVINSYAAMRALNNG